MNVSLRISIFAVVLLAATSASVRTFADDSALLFTPAFYRAINLNGAALTIDGNSWVASSGASNFTMSQTGGGTFANQSVTLVPSTDTNRATMIRSSIYGNVSLAMSSVPSGYYNIYLYVWEDNNPESYTVFIEGSSVLSNGNTGSAGAWVRLGPYRTHITDGTINVTTTGNPNVSGLEVWTANSPPVVSTPLPDHTAIIDDVFNYTVPSSTFSDPDAGTTFTYTATLDNGNPLPSWLGFNATTRKFSGTPLSANAGTISIRVTASDGELTANDIFTITSVNKFYRAINLNGSALTIDGNSWEASASAPNFNFSETEGGTFSNQSVTLVPSTDANRATMIRSSIYGSTANVNVTSVPSGIYDISLYVWEDNSNETYSLSLEGTTVVSNASTGTPGAWSKLGPFRRTITDGAINFTETGNVNMSGIEILRAGTGETSLTVTVTPASLTLASGQSSNLQKAVTPNDGSNQSVSWSSSNTSIATVSSTGVVTAVAAGNVTIAATSTTGDYTGTCSLTVLPPGSSSMLNPEFDYGLDNWSVLDFTGTTVNSATVVQNGGLSGSNSLYADIVNNTPDVWKFQVRNALPFNLVSGRTYHVSFMARAQAVRDLTVTLHGETANYDYSYNIISIGTTAQSYSFSYTASGAGLSSEAFFTLAFYLSNASQYDIWIDKVLVEDVTGVTQVTGVSVSPTTLSLNAGATGQITKTIAPANATNQNVAWTSSNASVATVSNTGLVTGVSAGSATITVTTQNGGKIATTAVTVNSSTIPVTAVSVSPASVTVSPGQTSQLTKTITPSNATNQNVTWSSDNTSIATVSSTGLVTAVAVGSANITATTVSGGFTSTSVVTVRIPVTSVSFANPTFSLDQGGTASLSPIVLPENATNKAVTWSSSNPGVATIDASGNLVAVAAGTTTITAVSVDQQISGTTNVTVIAPQAPGLAGLVDLYAFQYKYDGKKRMTEKKVPGAGWVYMVYDDRDRLVLTQDANQRGTEWTFTKYDALNRPVLTGKFADTRDLATIQNDVNQFYVAAASNSDEWFETRVDAGTGVHAYSNNSFPKVASESSYLTVTYYDDYTFIPGSLTGFTYDANQLTASGNDVAQEAQNFGRVSGQTTGGKVKNLETGEWMLSVNYYDDHYRVIQSISQNNKGGMDKVTSVYDFAGKVLRTKTDHTISGQSAITTARRLSYDHVGKLLKTEHSLNSAPYVVLAQNEYNELGQLIKKSLHATDEEPVFRQQVDYRYNIRGWVTRINDSQLSNAEGGPTDYFGMNLGYDDNLGMGGSSAFNGNISAIKYSTAMRSTERGYKFDYDPMNRLHNADYMTNTLQWNASASYNEHNLQYDFNGNIRNLDRDGDAMNIDGLTYQYSGNRLLGVEDSKDVEKGFVNGNTVGFDYDYDDNGNMKLDRNKGIASIEYNHLNLPRLVVKSNGDYIKYVYSAAGVKLAQEVYVNNALNKKTDYLGEFNYENDALTFLNHEEGRVVLQDEEPQYQYTLKDHLGNNRITFSAGADIAVATLEADKANAERANFLKYDDVRKVNNILFDHTNTGTTHTSVRLSGIAAETFGLAKSIAVMPGDKVKAEVYAKYVDVGESSGISQSLRDLLLLIAAGQTSAGVIDGPSYGSTGVGTIPFGDILDGDKAGEGGTVPKAYLNYIVFDENFDPILASSGYDRISSEAMEDGLSGSPEGRAHELLQSPEIEINVKGYVYIYLSNEEGGNEVYFDDFRVEHSSPIVQEEEYYPFGLTYNSYSRENSVDQNYKFQGQEHIDDLNLGWDSFKWRNYMPDIGRFFNIDPLADKYVYNSPFAFSENHVTTHVELEGLEKVSIHSASFAPFNTFGGPFLGDGANRKFSTDPQASSRIYGNVNLNLSGSGITQTGEPNARGSLSVNLATMTSSYSEAEMTSTMGGQYANGTTAMADVGFNLSGNNSQMPGSPDIDAKGQMQVGVVEMGENGSMATFSGAVTGDKFPANETYITDQNGTGVFLGVSGADGNPFTSLPGDNNRQMSQFTIGVKFDAQGSIQSVQHNGQTYSTEDWNKRFQNQNPQSGNTSTNNN